MRKTKLIAIALPFLVIAGASFFWPGSPVPVIGNIPPQDLAEIKRAVRRELREDTFPDFPKPSFTDRLCRRWSQRIIRIQQVHTNREVDVVTGVTNGTLLVGGVTYGVKWDPDVDGWCVISSSPWFQVPP